MVDQPTCTADLSPNLCVPPGGNCQIHLDVRPTGFTFLAHVDWNSSTPPDRAQQLLDGVLRRVDDFWNRFREQFDPPSEVPALPAEMDPWEENLRLRSALEDCVAACEPLLTQAVESGCEGCEGDQARAWLALDAARQALAEPASVHKIAPGLPFRDG